MPSLRALVLQAYNVNGSFCSVLPNLSSSTGSDFNNHDSKSLPKNKNKTKNQNRSPLHVRINMHNSYHEKIHRHLNRNINSLSQLLNEENKDYQTGDNFVHALQLREEPHEFWAIETVKS